MNSPSSKQILKDAREKHSLNFPKGQWNDLIALVNYARHIGYNEGWKDGAEEEREKMGY